MPKSELWHYCNKATIYWAQHVNMWLEHGILKLRQCMQHFEFWLRVRCWSNKSLLIFQFILSCRFFRLHCKHQIFNILQYFKYISDYFWLGVCILNGNERINWRKYIYSYYNPYKKVSLYRKPSQCSYFMINKGLKKSAKKRIKWTIALEFELFDRKMNTKYI